MSKYKILVQIDNNYQLNLRNSKLGDLTGFAEKILKKTEYGDGSLPNITNSIDMSYINTDAITNTILNGVNTNTAAVISTQFDKKFSIHIWTQKTIV